MKRGYRDMPSCESCKHVFVWEHLDGERKLYCNRNGEPRPLSGNFEEPFTDYDDDDGVTDEEEDAEYEQAKAAWEKWSAPRHVSPSGICDDFEQEEGSDER